MNSVYYLKTRKPRKPQATYRSHQKPTIRAYATALAYLAPFVLMACLLYVQWPNVAIHACTSFATDAAVPACLKKLLP